MFYMTSNQSTVFDTVTNRIRDNNRRVGGGNTSDQMLLILDYACINTNDTFDEQGREEVSVEEWNKVFTRNVEFLMSTGEYDATACGNLKHYGFKP